MQSEDKTQAPSTKAYVQAKSLAETKLLNTPVMQYLLERGEGKWVRFSY